MASTILTSCPQAPHFHYTPMGLHESRWAQGPHQVQRTRPNQEWSRPTTAVHEAPLRRLELVVKPLEQVAKPREHAVKPPSPRASPPAVVIDQAESKRELARYNKIESRFQWKQPYLEQGYLKATNRLGVDPKTVADNEMHFKLDFFEYYMHLERALVHLMLVFGISVGSSTNGGGASGSGSRMADSRHNPHSHPHQRSPYAPSTAKHSYHANVLQALDHPDNPLRAVLGGDSPARAQLARAKELRNRWKNGGVDTDDDDDGGRKQPPAPPLETYRLEEMLPVIHKGLIEGRELARRHLYGKDGVDGAAPAAALKEKEDEMEVDDEDWAFMVDAMDWEAL